jgi:hypothetical protein
MYVPTVEDYKKWVDYTSLSNIIPKAEEDLDAWDNRDNVPFMYRPTFTPFYTRKDLEDMKTQVANYDMSFVAPVRVNYTEPDEEE